MDDQDIGGILDLAYGAAVEPALWSRFLEAFAHLAGAEAVLAASPQARCSSSTPAARCCTPIPPPRR